jgi:hypothetical protein
VTNLGAQNGDNGGNQLLFDYLETTVQLAPAGSDNFQSQILFWLTLLRATVENTTIQETDPRLTFTGEWIVREP